MPNALLEDAALTRPKRRGDRLAERLFAWSFDGFVYNQIWEDPIVDLAAMEPVAGKRILTIASAGCNVLNYLDADPEAVVAVDLNPAHVALSRLKVAALEHLPDHETFFRFFGHGADQANVDAYDHYLKPYLDEAVRDYWDDSSVWRGRRIELFRRGLYRRSLLGRTIKSAHLTARLLGGRPRSMLRAKSRDDQTRLFERHLAPVFEKRAVRRLARTRAAYYGLGIPPNQYRALHEASSEPAAEIRERVRRLACDFDLADNYFAWQAFGRGYDLENREAVPPYLKPAVYERIKPRAQRVSILNDLLVHHLADQPAASYDRYVFLDAQDWMTRVQLQGLWREVTRTARPGGKVIFRTAGAASPLADNLSADLLAAWHYDAVRSEELFKVDRSAIYGGFHVYELKAS
ncbi:MAG: DUF3419 family protein [Pseudomonadota bacterium]